MVNSFFDKVEYHTLGVMLIVDGGTQAKHGNSDKFCV